jgi:uncharacterized OB-fold protein
VSETSGLEAARCPVCGWRGFPARLWCPVCGSDGVRPALVHGGVVEEVTTLRRALGRELTGEVRLGLVRLAGGGVAICRLDGATAGERVRLSTADGAPVARPLR